MATPIGFRLFGSERLLSSFALVVLCGNSLMMIRCCRGFAPEASRTNNHRARCGGRNKSADKTCSTTVLAMDPYELQYQQYTNAHAQEQRNAHGGNNEVQSQATATIDDSEDAVAAMREEAMRAPWEGGTYADSLSSLGNANSFGESSGSSYDQTTYNQYRQNVQYRDGGPAYPEEILAMMKEEAMRAPAPWEGGTYADSLSSLRNANSFGESNDSSYDQVAYNNGGESIGTATSDLQYSGSDQYPTEDETITASNGAVPMDPYERQSQQYAQSSVAEPQTHFATENNNEMAHSSTSPSVTADQSTNTEEDHSSDTTITVAQTQQQESIPTADITEPKPSKAEEKEESLDDQFLKMLQSEVQVKKLLGQNTYALTDIDLRTITGRFLDNLEDSTQKRNGKLKGQSKFKGAKAPKEERKTVVVLGTGWGAHAFVKLASTYDLRIVVVSPVNHFVFTPMLASAAVGTIEYRSMTEPIRVTNPYIDNYVEGRAIGIDVPGKKVKVQLAPQSTVTGTFRGIASQGPCRLEPEADDGDADRVIELNYDILICAVGTASRSSIVPGAKENCFNLKTSQDSKRLRTALGEALEYASRPTVQEAYYSDVLDQEAAREERRRILRFVLVGGGPTGVELAGELSDFFKQVCRTPDGAFQRLAADVSIILVHGGSDLLPSMAPELRQRALEALYSQGVEVRLNTRLKEVGRDFVRIGKKGSDEEETIPVGLTVWAAGNAPVPFINEMLSQLPESATGSAGRINVDRWLRCPTPTPETFGSILVLGDVACLETPSKHDPIPTALPQTAQVAGQSGAFAARMLNRGYDLEVSPPRIPETSNESSLLRAWLQARGIDDAPEFTFLSLGLLAYIGGEEALNQVELGEVPIFNYSGKLAFALWRSVYLTKQASTRNQALITFDWFRTQSFGRDITRL